MFFKERWYYGGCLLEDITFVLYIVAVLAGDPVSYEGSDLAYTTIHAALVPLFCA